jgi:hypothetical protein
MRVRRMKRRDPKTGAALERWFVDVDYQCPNGQRVRVRKVAPVQTRRGAEEYERQILSPCSTAPSTRARTPRRCRTSRSSTSSS